MPELEAYLYSVYWPLENLTPLGKLSWFLTGGGAGHLGIVFKNVDPRLRDQLRQIQIGHGSAFTSEIVSFDVSWNQKPEFQGFDRVGYFGQHSTYQYYQLFGGDSSFAMNLFKACLQIAVLRPKCEWYHRFTALFGGVIPLNAARSSPVNASNCASITMRAIAMAMQYTQFGLPYTQSLLSSNAALVLSDDFAAMRVLGLQQPDIQHPFESRRLAGFTPRAALEAMMNSKVILGPATFGPTPQNGESAVSEWLPLLKI